MKPINEFSNSKYLQMMFVGPSGSAKSTAGASLGEIGPYVNCDFDRRARGIMDAVKQSLISGDNVFVEEFASDHEAFIQWNKFLEIQLANKRANVFQLKTIQISSLFSWSRAFKNISKHTWGGGMKIKNKGNVILTLDGQQEFNAEITGTHQSMDCLRMLPCNIILDAHVIPRWGRVRHDADGNPLDALGNKIEKSEEGEKELEALQRSPNEVIGNKINARPEYAESVLSYFDNVFEFDKEVKGSRVIYTVEFVNSLAKNSFGVKPGKHDITGQSFYKYFKKLTGWDGV